MLAFATGKTEVRKCELCEQEVLHREMELHRSRLYDIVWHAVPHGCKGILKEPKKVIL